MRPTLSRGSGLPGRAKVDIAIDVTERRIRIRDKGPGLSREEALERLMPIGSSDKTLGIDRGFRGVGRLAGLAFAKTVSFTTRAREDQTGNPNHMAYRPASRADLNSVGA